MATPTVYRSDDGSAPSLSGTAGSLVALLDAILVNGYGSKAAAGWTKPYTGTNKAAFRAGGGHQRYLRVDDAAAQMGRITAFGAMTSVDAGTLRFPEEIQIAGGLYTRKSTTADSTARPWICYATDDLFYLIIGGAVTSITSFGGGDSHLSFGDYESAIIGDRYNTLLVAATNSSTSDTSNALGTRHTITAWGTTGNYGPGTAQMPYPCIIGKRSAGINSQTSCGVSGTAVPNPANSKIHLSRIAVFDATSGAGQGGYVNAMRGWMRGVWAPDHIYSGFTSYDTFGGTAGSSLDGKDFQVVLTAGTNAIIFETNGGW